MEVLEKLPLFNESLRDFGGAIAKDNEKVEKIAPFDGDPKTYKIFTTSVDLRFLHHPVRYETAASRRACIFQLCSGRAANWCVAILSGNRPELLADYAAFLKAFEGAFEDREYVVRMQKQYMKKHLAGSVANFITSFEEAAFALGYSENMMAAALLDHMKGEVRKALYSTPTLDTTDYQMVRRLAIQVDTNLWEEQKLSPPPRQPAGPRLNPARPQHQPAPRAGPSAPRGPLTPETRQYRVDNNLCAYCGAQGHWRDNCPVAQSAAARRQLAPVKLSNTYVDPDTLPPAIKHVRYHPSVPNWRPPTDSRPRTRSKCLTIRGKVGGRETEVMVDSGAEANFINEKILPSITIERSSPLNCDVVAADGHVIVAKHNTKVVDVECDLDGLGKDTISFVVAPLAHRTAIAGAPYLEAKNPDINWATGEVKARRKRPAKKPSIQTHRRIFFTATKVAGIRRGPRRLSNTKALAMMQQHKAQETRRQTKREREAATTMYRRIKTMTQRIRNFIRTNLSRNEPGADTAEENKTTPINWEEPNHALELNALLKEHELEIQEQLPEHYKAFAEVFSKPKAEELAPHRPGFDHRIEFKPGAKPRRGRVYRMTDAELKLLKTYIEDGLRRGWIRRSKSPSAEPVMFRSKPHDSSLRLCVDYRQTNANTIKNAYPLPNFDDFLPKLHGAKYFTKLDLRNAFHLLRVAEGDEWKTAFITKYGLYEYQVMPFGLCNAPASFQAWMDDLFREMSDVMMCYLDDILIWGSTKEEVIERTTEVLQILQANNLYARVDKCQFEVTTTWFLGYILQHNAITIDPSRVALVTEWPEPKTLKQVQSFLGFVNFYRRFIPRFSEIAHGLTSLTRKDNLKRRFELGAAGAKSFQALKQAFQGNQILHIWDPDLPAILETDASVYAIAGILSQMVDGVKVPIA
ncbi:MAG: reverse transcriptase domain-containing protein, partial [Janthinobacterium lividum]